MMNEAFGGIVPTYSVNDGNCGCRNDDGYGFGGGAWIWVIFLFFIMAWGGNWGGFGGFGGNGAGLNGALTRADLCQDMNFQQLENGVRGIQQGLCDGFYAQNSTMLNGFNGIQNTLCQSTAAIESSLCNGFNNTNNNITQARFDAQQCCCETNRNIDAVRYENAKNTCDIINAGNANTQRIIDTMTQNTIQDLRDKATTYELQLSQQAQTANLISQLNPSPRPAYITCSPYQAQMIPYSGYTGCGCNCGNNGCC